VRGKDHRAAVGYFVQLFHENRSQPAQPVDNEAIVDNFMPDIDRRAEPLDRQLDDLDGAIDSGAKAARSSDQQLKFRLWKAHGARCKASLAASQGASYDGRQSSV
jgi:hypothetical protein